MQCVIFLIFQCRYAPRILRKLKDVKEAAYKGLEWPILEYASPVWDPHGIVVQEELEKVQNRAARFVTGNYNFETGSVTSILEQLGWESLHKRRKGSKLIAIQRSER